MFDLISLPPTHPDIYQQMLKGFFSFAKTKRPFSRMALDQVHEQNNKIIKGVEVLQVFRAHKMNLLL